MDVIKAMKSRHCVRAFQDKPVETQDIKTILDAARYAPSGVNTQPWHVSVITGETLKMLGDRILEARAAGKLNNPDYAYYPAEWPEPYKSRRKACGMALYGALEIDKEDTEARLVQWNKNYRFFGAPLGLIISIDKRLEQGSWMDMGMFIQNIMLAAQDLKLGTCPQASMAEHPDIVREVLKIPDTDAIVCGIAIGYPDESDPVNRYRTDREPVDDFTTWYE